MPLFAIIALCVLAILAFPVRAIPGPFRRARNRRPRVRVSTPAVFTAEFTTPNVLLTFDAPVILQGIPQLLTDTGKLPVSATQPSDKTVQLVYDTPGSVTTVTVPANDPAIRTSTGGLLPAGTFPAA